MKMNKFTKYLTDKTPGAIILVFIALIILIIYVKYIDSVNENLRNASNAVVPAILIGLIFTALSKLNLILNIQDISKEAQKNLGDLGALISGNTNHGLSGTISEFDGVGEISRLKKGDEVFWLDTRIASVNIVTSLGKALNAGVKIKVLTMHPESEAAKYRYLDITSATDFNAYKESLYHQKKELDLLVSKTEYDIQVAYTKEVISLPILIVKSGNHEYAYTGYFIHDRAIEFPYVYWKSGEDGLIDNLETFFHRKWVNAEAEKDIAELIANKEQSRPS